MSEEKNAKLKHLKEAMLQADERFIDESELKEAQESGEFDGVGIASIEQTTTSSADGGTNVITITLTDGTKKTFTVKNGSKGSTGATGGTGATGATGTRGSMIYWGTAITGTSTTATVFGGSGISSALVNDLYLNTSTWNVYQCTTAGAASAAKWKYVGNIKGDTGATGTRGATINLGTAITGTSTTATIFSSSGISSAVIGDLYINTSTFNLYRCTTAGAASAAKWVYVGCLKGATGTFDDTALKDYLPLTGGTLTGNLNGKYITGTWLQTTSATDLNKVATKFAVLDTSGWVYYRTASEMLSDLGAAASSHNQAASTITAGTFAGQVVAKAGAQAAGTNCLRNSKLVASEETPTEEGAINWVYG